MLTTLRNKPRYRAISLYHGLVSVWNLDEFSDGSGAVTRNDSWGTNHLTDNATVESTAGLLGNAAHLQSANSEFLSLAHNATIAQMTAFTLAGWVRFHTIANVQVIAGKNWDTGWNARKLATTHNLRFYCGAATNFVTSGANPVGENVWAFVGWIFDGSLTGGTNRARIWVNDALLATTESGTIPDTIANSAGDFLLGTSAGIFADIDLDEVGYWSRALSSAELTQLYNGGTPLVW